MLVIHISSIIAEHYKKFMIISASIWNKLRTWWWNGVNWKVTLILHKIKSNTYMKYSEMEYWNKTRLRSKVFSLKRF